MAWWNKSVTASNIEIIVKSRNIDSYKSKVKQILYEHVRYEDAIVHGRVTEKKAISHFEALMGINLHSCGIFIDENIKYLGAKPEGLVGDDAIIVEVKCPFFSLTRKSKTGENKSLPETLLEAVD